MLTRKLQVTKPDKGAWGQHSAEGKQVADNATMSAAPYRMPQGIPSAEAGVSGEAVVKVFQKEM